MTDGLQGDLAPVTVTGRAGRSASVWQAICHAANYIIYRRRSTGGDVGTWTQIGTYATPGSATLPDNSSATRPRPRRPPSARAPRPTPPRAPASRSSPSPTPARRPRRRAPRASPTRDTPSRPAGRRPIVENANELPWEQNPYFTPALEAAGITTVGADALQGLPQPARRPVRHRRHLHRAPPTPPASPSSTAPPRSAPRHPINVFYNVATNAQELDEYNTLYSSAAPDSQCHDTATVTCSRHPVHLPPGHQPGRLGHDAERALQQPRGQLRPPDQHHRAPRRTDEHPAPGQLRPGGRPLTNSGPTPPATGPSTRC